MALQEMIMGDQLANEGRQTDSMMAHVTPGEVVIPVEMLQDPEVQQAVQAIFAAYEVDPAEFTVGSGANKINPETGQPEFFFKRIFRRVAPVALPILGSLLAPGVGTALGSTLGKAATMGIGGALGGAAGGAVTGGGLKGALTGAALGGAGGFVGGGGLGQAAGSSLASTTGNAMMQGPTQGTGLLGAATRATGGLSGALGGGGSTGGLGGLGQGSALRLGGTLVSGINQSRAMDEMEEQMLAAQGRAADTMRPFQQVGLDAQRQASGRLTEGFDPSQLENDPGYQYRLQQGDQALQRQLAAQGMGQSGAAMRAAQEMGQGMASQQYDQAYNQWLQRNQQQMGLGGSGLQAAGGLSGIYGDMGTTRAATTGGQAQNFTNTLAEGLGTRLVGFDPQTGRPIYG